MKIETMREIAFGRANVLNFIDKHSSEEISELTGITNKDMKAINSKLGYRHLCTLVLSKYNDKLIDNDTASRVFEILESCNNHERQPRFKYSNGKYYEWSGKKFVSKGSISIVKYNRIVKIFGEFIDDAPAKM